MNINAFSCHLICQLRVTVENRYMQVSSNHQSARSCMNHLLQPVIDCRNSVPGTQYLFLPPNRYIFHGAEVYSDSEDDIISSSSCGSSSESGSCRSQSLDVEDESEMEEFYNGIEDEDAPEREEEPGFGEDGAEQEELAAEESADTNEAAGTEHPSNAL